MKKIVIIMGSTRKQSFNAVVANAVAEALKGKAEVEFLDFQDVPFVNQDIEFPAPAPVARIREVVAAADGIWVVTPEYNYSYPGYVKNVLDWLSRPLIAGDPERISTLTGKKSTASSIAGGDAGAAVLEKLNELLAFIGTDVLKTDQAGLMIPGESWVTNELTLSDEDLAKVNTQVERFLEFIEN
ncbi:MAG: NADPH-dependent FMN reductase [Corynebacterium sp.]|nr:NADPH-dependent FMN reductase [Corynebacterium sp.]